MPHPQYKGQNLPVYSVQPNWKSNVALRTLYNTIVKEALDLSESRIARFPRSLFGLRYRTLPLSGQETGYIRRVVELAQALPVVMPVWTDGCKLLEAVAEDATELSVDDIFPTLFEVLPDYVIIWSDFKTWEILAVDNFDGDIITLADPTSRAWPVNSMVYPILIGKLAGNETKQITDEHGVHSVEFDERFHGLTDQSIIEIDTPEMNLAYTDSCRAEFVVTATALQPEKVYALEISDSEGGDYSPHIFFALMTEEELASQIKVLTVNNDYNGEAWFRIALVHDGEGDVHILKSRPKRPQASVIPAPEISIANLSEITTQVQLTAIEGLTTGASDGLRPLDFYSDGGWIIPYSIVEDPLIFNSDVYRRFQKKYGWKQWPGEDWDGNLVEPVESLNYAVTVDGVVGGTTKFTRDGSDPTEETVQAMIDGIADNAAPGQHTFGGIIKARCFKDGCRSPLAMVAVDKVMVERSRLVATNQSGDATSFCDLPVDGFETALSCNLYGGDCGFQEGMYEDLLYTYSTESAGATGPIIAARSKNSYGATYIGWPIHVASVSKSLLFSSLWKHHLNGWNEAATTHSWAYVDATSVNAGDLFTAGVIETDVEETLVGEVNSFRDSDWRDDRDTYILDHLSEFSDPVCNIDITSEVRLTRFDVMRSPLYWLEMRDVKWDSVKAGDFTPPPDPEPDPEPFVSVYGGDDWEAYPDGDATAFSLDQGNEWEAASEWVIEDGPAPAQGEDDFESYAVGEIEDSREHEEWEEFEPFDDGSGWEPGGEWRFSTGEFAAIHGEDFESYADGAVETLALEGGTGFEAGVGTGWVVGTGFVLGSDDWESYSDGATVGGASGVSWITDNWRWT